MSGIDESHIAIVVDARLDGIQRQLQKLNTETATQLSRLVKTAESQGGSFEKAFGGLGLRGSKAFSAALQDGASAVSGYASKLGPLGSLLTTLGGGWLLAGGAAGGFAAMIEQGTEKLAEHQKLLLTINGVLKATEYSSGQTGASIQDMAERISESTLQNRNDVLAASAELASFGNIGPDAFEKVLRAAVDMTTVFGGELVGNTQKLARALEDPISGMKTLRRVMGDLTPTQKEMIQGFVKSGDEASAQGVILDALKDKIGGAGGAAAGGLQGAVHKLDEAWNYLLEDMAKTGGAGAWVTVAVEKITTAVHSLDTAIKSAGGVLEFLALLSTAGLPGGFGAAGTKGAAPALRGSVIDDNAAANGPARRRKAQEAALVQAVGDAAKAMKEKAAELRKTPLAQAIDKAIAEVAAKQQLSPEALIRKSQGDPALAAQLGAIRETAIEEFNYAQGLKESKKSAKEAAAEEKKLAAERARAANELSRKDAAAWKTVDDLFAAVQAKSGQPGAERTAAVQSAMEKIPGPSDPTDMVRIAQQTAAGIAGGEKFDADALEAQLAKGRDLVRNYQDQADALGKDKVAAEADKYEHDALVEVYQKLGYVTPQVTDAIKAEADAIRNSGKAAQEATDAYKAQIAISDNLRSGLEKIGEDGLKGFRDLRSVLHEVLASLAQTILKVAVLDPMMDALLGKQGTAGGGLLGSLLFSGPGGGAPGSGNGAGAPGGIPVDFSSAASAGSSAASNGSFWSGLGSFFSDIFGSFAQGGPVHGRGSNRSDSNLARLSRDEFVVRSEPARQYRDVLEAMNAGLPMFGAGGSVGRISVPRIPSVPRLTAQTPTLHAPMTIHIDARGAELGVEDKIAAKMAEYHPVFVESAMRQFDHAFPGKLSDTLANRG